uniref:Uncharacterized protein n=1 Tax=Fagus sylvatica TaxID=28930 RepID=A0A2N9I9S6_FAGSY
MLLPFLLRRKAPHAKRHRHDLRFTLLVPLRPRLAPPIWCPPLQRHWIEFKKKALESLFQLLAQDDNSPAFVAKEGNIGYLIHLLDFNDNLIREHAGEVRLVRGLCLLLLVGFGRWDQTGISGF